MKIRDWLRISWFVIKLLQELAKLVLKEDEPAPASLDEAWPESRIKTAQKRAQRAAEEKFGR